MRGVVARRVIGAPRRPGTTLAASSSSPQTAAPSSCVLASVAPDSPIHPRDPAGDHRVQLASASRGCALSFAEICDGSSRSIGSGHSIPRAGSRGLTAVPAIPGTHSWSKQ
jgi:hypothetical protein